MKSIGSTFSIRAANIDLVSFSLVTRRPNMYTSFVAAFAELLCIVVKNETS